MYQQLSEREEWIAKQVVDIAIRIHKALGPGLLESVYEKCFVHELGMRSIAYKRQKQVPIVYNSILVEDLVILELKAQENYHPVWEAQLLSYLKLTDMRLGFLINFHVPLMKNGIKRIIL
jgi:GxxExxY protein